jgi:autotransporter-associated beta strand protein
MALRTRVNNAPASLQVTTAWSPALSSTGAFLTTDQLYWNGVTGTNATTTMGGNINVGGTGGGVRLDAGQTTNVTLNNATAATLTLGTLGIDLSTTGAVLTVGPTAEIALNANQTWNLKAGAACVLDCRISGGYSINYASGGTWFVGNATGNTYTGGTTVNGCVVRVGSGTAFGTGTVTINNAQVSSNSTTGYTLANALTLNGTMTLQDATNTGALTINGTTTVAGTTTLTSLGPRGSNLVFSGVIGNNTGSAYTFTLTGTSDVVLNSASAGTFNGAVVWTGTASRVLYLAGYNTGTPHQLNGASSITVNQEWQILGNGANTFSSSIGGTNIIYVRNTSASGITFNGSMASYTGSLRFYADSNEGANPVQKITLTRTDQFNFENFIFLSGDGLTTLSQTLSYAGNSAVTNGAPLIVFGTTAAPTAVFSNDTSVAGTLVTHTNVVQTGSAITATFRVAANNGPVTFTQVISNPNGGILNFSKTGSHAVTLSGANTFTGTVSISAGTLNANSATALGAASSTAAITFTSTATISLGAALNYSSPGRSTSIGGFGVGSSGALIHAFAGTANVGTISCGSTAYIRATQTGTLSSGIVTSGVSDVIVGVDSNRTLTLSGGISGTGRLVVGRSVSDAGTVYLSTSNSYAGVTSLEYGTLLLGNNNALGTSGGLTFSGNPTIDAAVPLAIPLNYMTLGANITFGGTADLILYGDFDLNAASRTITTNGTVGLFTLFGTISGASRKLVKAGGNRLKLSPTNGNTYTGGTDITAGTLQAAHVTALGTTGTTTLTASGATLQTLTTGGQNGRLTVAALTNSAGGTIKIGG